MDVPRDVGVREPQLWALNDQHKPSSKAETKKFHETIKFLQDNHGWVTDNPEKAKKIFSLLDRTCHLSTEALAIQRTLIRNFPLFFPTVAVEIGGQQSPISIKRLTELNEKYDTMFASAFAESKATKITLKVPDGMDDPEVLPVFLTFLEGGDVKITEENALDLLRLAQENNYPRLAADCAKFIGQNLDLEDLPTFKELLRLLTCAISAVFLRLRQVCFH